MVSIKGRLTIESRVTIHYSLATVFGVEVVAKAVAEEVEGEDAEGDGHGREEDEVGGLEEVGAGVVEHGTPGGSGRLHTEAEEAEGGFGEHGGGHSDGCLYEEWLDDVGQDVAEQQAGVGGTERARGLEELALFQGHDLGADEAGVVYPTGEGEREDEVQQTGAEEGDDRDGEQDSGQGEEGVCEVDVDDGVGEATVEAGEQAEGDAEDQGDGDDGDGDGERDAGTVEGSGELVAAEFVGAEPMGERGRMQAGGEVEVCRVGADERGSEQGAGQDEQQNQRSDDSKRVSAEVGEGSVHGAVLILTSSDVGRCAVLTTFLQGAKVV